MERNYVNPNALAKEFAAESTHRSEDAVRAFLARAAARETDPILRRQAERISADLILQLLGERPSHGWRAGSPCGPRS